MKSLLIFMLVTYFTEIRRIIPSTMSKKIGQGIRAFENADPAVKSIVDEAKKSAAAEIRRRNDSMKRAGLGKHRLVGDNLKHIPCKYRK